MRITRKKKNEVMAGISAHWSCDWMHCFVSGFWQPRPAGPWLHLLAPSFHWPSDCQRGGLIRKATDLWGDWSDWTHSAGWADLPYWVSGFCVPQTAQCFCGREPWDSPQALANSPWKVSWGGNEQATCFFQASSPEDNEGLLKNSSFYWLYSSL